jgi:nucleotide-binding universal stress UspA family protein
MDPMGTVTPSIPDLEEAAKSQLESLVPENTPEGVTIHPVLLRGSPPKTIATFARKKDADLIVVGTHGRTGLGRLFMGSTAEALLRQAPCHVMVVKPRTTATVPAGE